jgi:DNA 3'-phosphatase
MNNWIDTGKFLYLPSNTTIKPKIFGFDLDGTLITYRSGQDPKFYNAVQPNDWHYLGLVKEKIIELSRDYTIVIITNQSKISNNKKQMIENIFLDLDKIPYVLCANRSNEYRKPAPTFMNIIFNILQQNGINLDIKNSFYCGDAIGKTDHFIPYQWSDDDLTFANNSGLRFVRPIDLFGVSNVIPTQDIIIMIGTPGSFKTTCSKLCEQHYGYVRFSQDEIRNERGTLTKDLKKHYQLIFDTLASGKKIVLDAKHSGAEYRNPWIHLGIQMNKTILIVWCIRCGRCFNKLRPEPISHFSYIHYVQSFTDPEYDPLSQYYTVAKIY